MRAVLISIVILFTVGCEQALNPAPDAGHGASALQESSPDVVSESGEAGFDGGSDAMPGPRGEALDVSQGDASWQSDVETVGIGAPAPDLSPPQWPPDATLALLSEDETSLVLYWSVAFDDDALAAYLLFQDGAEIVRLDAATNLFEVTDLNPGAPLTFRVEAEDLSGNLSKDGPELSVTLKDTQAPTLPTDLTLEALEIGSGSVLVGWTTLATSDEIKTWRLWRDLQPVAEVDAEASTFLFDALAPFTTYTLQLSALDAAGHESTLSEPLTLTTLDESPPTWPLGAALLAVDVGENALTLTWPESKDNHAIDHYAVSQDGEVMFLSEGVENFAEIDGLSPWTLYDFEVVAFDPSGLSSAPLTLSVRSADTTAPSWPEASVDALVGIAQVTLSWSAAEDAGALAGYRIYRNNILVAECPASVQTMTIEGVPALQAQQWRVEAFDEAGNASLNGPQTSVTLEDLTPPTWPAGAGVALLDKTTTSATILWDEALDDSGVASYEISVDGALHTTLAASITQTLISGLPPGAPVTLSIRARDLAENLSQEALSLGFNTSSPGMPTWPNDATLEATKVTSTEVDLAWSLPNSDVEVASFHIYVDESLETSTPFPTQEIGLGALSAESTLTFRVEAVGVTGLASNSGPSLVITTLPLTAPQWTEGAQLFASAESETSVKLSWTGAPSGTLTYHIYVDALEVFTVQAPSSEASLGGLEAGTTLELRVEASGPSGLQSINGPAALITTLDETPPSFSPADTLEVTSVGESSAELSWTPASDNVAVVAYRLIDLSNGLQLSATSAETDTVTLTGLEPNTQYALQIEAGDASGNWSTQGPTATFQTQEASSTVDTSAVYSALAPFCSGCHFGEFVSVSNFEAGFVDDPTIITPGDPDESKLVQYLEGTYPGPKSQMPPFGLSYQELVEEGEAGLPMSAIRAWISAMEAPIP